MVSMDVCVFCVLLGVCLHTASSLTCYLCPRTVGQTLVEANLECLSRGWEISCSAEEDRCYSTNYPDNNEVEKGCTSSRSCVENTACCEGSYCNADPQRSKTGVEQPCRDINNCIQGDDVMKCARRQPTDITKSCLCTDVSYQRGFICQKKSYPDGHCSVTSHCYDINTRCVSRVCRCADGMFSNGTICSQQALLGEACQQDKECRGPNTQCTGTFCACAFGYIVQNGTSECSSGCSITSTYSWIFVMLSWIISQHMLTFDIMKLK